MSLVPTRLPSSSPSAPSARSVLAVLRAETRAAHEAVEAVVPLMGDDVSRAVYRRYLARMLGYCEPAEAHFASLPAWERALPDARERRKSGALAADLKALGATDADLRALPRCSAGVPVRDLASAFGVAYVLEGSALGGVVLARHLTAALAPRAEDEAPLPVAFLTVYGPRLGAMWRTFGAHLEAYAAAHPSAERAIVDAARGTFAALTDFLRADDHDGPSATASAP